MPNATPFLGSKEDIAELMLSAFPNSYLYRNNDGLKKIINGFAKSYYDVVKDIQDVFDDFFNITKDSQFLDKYLAEYGLPNVIFPDIENSEQAAFAISAMKTVNTLVSETDYVNFLALIGLEVKFHHYQNTLLPHHGFPYVFPMILGGVPPKNKVTWLVDVVDSSDSQANLGVTAPIYLFNPTEDTNFAKKILAYLKPDYIIFRYLDSATKALYGIT